MKSNCTSLHRRLGVLMGLFCALAWPLSADTVLIGSISQDSTLEASKSPYLVLSSLNINRGVTLTVPADVVLQFSPGSNLYVYGNVIATGATFTSNQVQPEAGDWGRVYVGNGGDSAKITMTDCVLANFYGVEVRPRGTVALTNTNVMNTEGDAFYLQQQSVLSMTGGSLETNSSNAKSNYSAVNGFSSSLTTLDGVSIQGYQMGVEFNTDMQVNMAATTITNCHYPLFFRSIATLNVGGQLLLTGNTYDYARVDFNYMYNNWNLPSLPIPYYFGGFNVQAGNTLTVASGAMLKFTNGGRLQVDGSLNAVANPGEWIYFTSSKDDNLGGDSNNDQTSTAPAARDWEGIYFTDQSVDTTNILRRCAVRYAGGGDKGGIRLYNASPTIDSCDIANNYIGIWAEGLSNPLITNTEIGSSVLVPLAISFEANPVMAGNELSLSDNKYDAIGIIPGTMQGDAHLVIRSLTDLPNMTYYLMGDVTVPAGKTLTIDPGITIKAYYEDWYNRHILVEGSLIADATADSMITFTSVRDDNHGYPNDCNNDGAITSPVAGDWGGILFLPGSTGLMDYCRIKYASISSKNFSSCNTTVWIAETALAIVDADPVISNCEFKDLKHAIFCYRAANPVLDNLELINVQFTPINLSSTSDPVITNITHTNVGWSALGLIGGPVCLDGTIRQRNVAGHDNISYILLSDLTINNGSHITIDPGVVVKFTQTNGFSGRTFYVDGGLKARGTAAQPVVFTSVFDDNEGYDANGDGNATTPDRGDWVGIKYRAAAVDTFNTLDHVIVKYAGDGGEGCVTWENAGGTLSNALVSNSYYYGLYFNGNANPTITGTSIQNCRLDPVAISLTSNPTFTDVDFVSNASKAVKVIEGTLSTNAVLAPRSMAGIDNIAYVVERLDIAPSAKLTILPGVVIKFRTETYPYNTWIRSRGNLVAVGDPDNKIYFTSYKDDSKGGDSNNNGNNDAPEPGDWGQEYRYDYHGGVHIINNTVVSDTVNVLKHCEFSYPSTAIRVDNAHATVDSCLIQLCMNYGVSSFGSANPHVSNTQFYNIGLTPVELSMFSNPSFESCTALNIGYMGMTVVPETFSKSDTIPVRSFAGYDNINYVMSYPCTINSGCTITIPEGVTFKSMQGMTTGRLNWWGDSQTVNGFVVNGSLNILGTADKPVVFTHAYDDAYGSPADMQLNGAATLPPVAVSDYMYGTWITFNDISADTSRIENALFKYGQRGIAMLSASPRIRKTTFEQLYTGIDMSGVSEPVIDSCRFHDLAYFPMQVSLVAYPASTLGNEISGTTYKVIKVRNETLTQDVTLPKRNFGGKDNIPYLFGDYEVGTSATLTIAPGVICKFRRFSDYYYSSSYGKISVSKGLKALGGASSDSLIVFTSIYDDFYGGDSNADGPTNGAVDQWDGLIFNNVSLDPECQLSHCVIRYARKGVQTTSASPTIDNTLFNRNRQAVEAAAASNPVITDCDFNENVEYAVKNVDKSFDIQAINCWWGNNDGPIISDGSTSNVGEQEYVTTWVNVEPWRTIGIQQPLTGDVSLNGLIQAYDASLVLKHAVSLITLNDNQQVVADVSGNDAISAYDASLILQYVVGMDAYFPVNKIKSLNARMPATDLTLSMPSINSVDESTFTLPVNVSTLKGLGGADLRLRFDPACLALQSLTKTQPSISLEYKADNATGLVNIAMAGAGSMPDEAAELFNLTFTVLSQRSTTTEVAVERFQVNEVDKMAMASNGLITISKTPVGLVQAGKHVQGMDPLYPNPFKGEANLVYRLDDNARHVTLELFSLSGQKLATLVDKNAVAGSYTLRLTASDLSLQPGMYLIRMSTDTFKQTQKFQVGF